MFFFLQYSNFCHKLHFVGLDHHMCFIIAFFFKLLHDLVNLCGKIVIYHKLMNVLHCFPSKFTHFTVWPGQCSFCWGFLPSLLGRGVIDPGYEKGIKYYKCMSGLH